jgi:hypothetical protein
MSHTLFVLALYKPQAVAAGLERFTKAYNIAMPEYSNDAMHKFIFFPVYSYVLIVKEL